MNTTTTIEKMIDSIAAVCIDLGLRGGYTPGGDHGLGLRHCVRPYV